MKSWSDDELVRHTAPFLFWGGLGGFYFLLCLCIIEIWWFPILSGTFSLTDNDLAYLVILCFWIFFLDKKIQPNGDFR